MANPRLHPEHCVSNNLHKTARAVTRIYADAMRPAGIQRSQFAILAHLSELGPVRLNVLADYLLMDRTTLSRNLKPLEAKGYVSIKPSATDGRAKSAELTPAGKDKYTEAAKLWRLAQERVVERFGEENWQALESTLQQLRSLIA